VCCLCGVQIESNSYAMCNPCLNSQENITSDIGKDIVINYCAKCDRYNRPPWVKLELESPQMMTFCLSKIKGLNKVKLVDASWVWTEPHSKRIKIKLTIQKEIINKTMSQQSCVVEYIVNWMQCDDCKRSFTKHLWKASCQLRQRVNHKRTFMVLEQIILKHQAHKKAINIKEEPEGVDFFFNSRNDAIAFTEFMQVYYS